jgi:hypothetical protein
MQWKGVKPLASSRFSSNTPDVEDITALLHAFEEHNCIQIKLGMHAVIVQGVQDIVIEAQAFSRAVEVGEAPSLASARLKVGAQKFKQMGAAIMWLLYQIDHQLAQDEFTTANKAV